MMRWDRLGVVVVSSAVALAFAAACGGPPPPKAVELDADPPLSTAGPNAGASTTHVQRAMAFIKAEKWQDAKSDLDQALTAQPTNAEANYYLGVVKEKLGDRDGATQSYKAAIASDPNLVEAANNLAAIYLDNPPRPDDAIPLLKKALAKSPDDASLRRNLAYAEGLKGDVAAASKEYEALLAKNDDPSIRLDYATMLSDGNDLDHAAEQLKKALEKTPDDGPTLATIGLLLRHAKAFGDCVRAYDRAIKVRAQAEWLIGRGSCHRGLKDDAGATADFEAAVKADPKNAMAHFFFGEALLAARQRGHAFDEFTAAASLAGDTEIGKAAKERLATLKDIGDKRLGKGGGKKK